MATFYAEFKRTTSMRVPVGAENKDQAQQIADGMSVTEVLSGDCDDKYSENEDRYYRRCGRRKLVMMWKLIASGRGFRDACDVEDGRPVRDNRHFYAWRDAARCGLR